MSSREQETADGISENPIWYGKVELENKDGTTKQHFTCVMMTQGTEGSKPMKRKTSDDDDDETAGKKKKKDITLSDAEETEVSVRTNKADQQVNKPMDDEVSENDKLLLNEIDHDEEIVDDFASHSVATQNSFMPFNSAPRSNKSGSHGNNIWEHLRRIEEKVDKLLKAMNSTNSQINEKVQVDSRFVTESGINLLTVRAVSPTKYALVLLDILFKDEELASSCCVASSHSSKPGLNVDKVALLEDCVKEIFGEEVFNEKANLIRRKCTQKCIDKRKLLVRNAAKDVAKVED